MENRLKQFIFLGIAVGLALVFLVLTLRKIENFDDIINAFKKANHFWILASMAISIYTYWLRAVRWNMLLEPIGYRIKPINGFWSIAFAYFMNLTIPRSGEIARATTLYKTEGVPVDKSFGTIVVERVIDLIFLGVFFLLTLAFNYETLISFLNIGGQERSLDGVEASSGFPVWVWYGLAGLIIGLGLLVVLALMKPDITRKLINRIFGFLMGIVEGMKSILKLKKRLKFFLYTAGIWICYFLMTYLVFFAFEETSHFGLAEGLFLIISGTLGMILPVSGGLGYPYIMGIAFSAIYVSAGNPVSEGERIGNYFGIIMYVAQVFCMILFGLLSIWFIAKNKKTDWIEE